MEIAFTVEPDLFWFQGHFSERAILPGVTQIDWVMHFSRQYLTPEYQFKCLVQVKFQAPLQPASGVVLTLLWREDQQILQFSYYKTEHENRQPISTGKIRLCQ
ncbi:hydroxymyristoyl-ACP dehydratase [Tatumella sp. UBA2305]|uniref:ApeI family dehydratase n=1 Tax=Tatumella sp. UBA2305 TaxID=1947647 RepID=UPI0039C8D67D